MSCRDTVLYFSKKDNRNNHNLRIKFWRRSYHVPVGGLVQVGLRIGSKVGSRSSMSWLRFSKVMSRSWSTRWNSGLGIPSDWGTFPCEESRQVVWPTLRTWQGITWDMPSIVGITVDGTTVFLSCKRHKKKNVIRTDLILCAYCDIIHFRGTDLCFSAFTVGKTQSAWNSFTVLLLNLNWFSMKRYVISK